MADMFNFLIFGKEEEEKRTSRSFKVSNWDILEIFKPEILNKIF